MKIDWNKKYTTVAIYCVLVFLACYLIFKFTDSWGDTKNAFLQVLGILAPFIYALVIAYFINPLVDFIEKSLFMKMKKKNLRRGLSILVTYIIIIGLIVLLMSFIVPQLISSIKEISGLLKDFLPWFEQMVAQGNVQIFNTGYYIDFTLVNDYLNENIQSTFSSVSGIFTNFAPILLNYLADFASALFNILLGFIIAIYLLLSKDASLLNARKFIFAIFAPRHAITVINLSKESNYIFIHFIVGKIIDSFIIGVICFVGLLIFRFPYALLLSVIVGITNMIPYFGPFIGGFVGFALLLFINPVQALWYMLFILILQQFDGNILGPKILGDSTGLSPFWVIFAIIVFGKFFGFAGMFFGVPVVAVIKNIIKRQIDFMYEKRMTTM